MERFRFDGYTFSDELGKPALVRPDRHECGLTASEGAILRYLIHRSNRPASAEQIFSAVWRRQPIGDESHTVETHVAGLRRKFGAQGRTIIATVKGGYQFTPVISGDPVLAPEDIRPPYLGPYSIEQATREDMIWISRFTDLVYEHPGDRPGEQVYLEWWEANPTGFSIIRNAQGKRVGNVDITALRPEALERFKKGEIQERNFRGADYFGPHERGAIKLLYIGSIATTIDRDTMPHEVEPHAADAVLRVFPKLIDRICDKKPTTLIYAAAASPKGARLLNACHFSPCVESRDRLGEHDLYSSTVARSISRLKVICRGALELDDAWEAILANARSINRKE